ncbi:hypothetical protein AAHA92_28558 [Salvia divinorum]|uniref:Uncharacterized protein n=1 Tax=Salvia divinorum TaxID=28513 RepID=A0ABD1FXW5_SALDI
MVWDMLEVLAKVIKSKFQSRTKRKAEKKIERNVKNFHTRIRVSLFHKFPQAKQRRKSESGRAELGGSSDSSFRTGGTQLVRTMPASTAGRDKRWRLVLQTVVPRQRRWQQWGVSVSDGCRQFTVTQSAEEAEFQRAENDAV